MVFKLFFIVIGVFVVDGFIFPALFGFRESFFSILALVLPVLYLGTEKRVVFFGLFFSFVLESLRGFNFGDLVIPFLLTVIVIYLVQEFLDIRHTYDTRFSLSKSALFVPVSLVLVFVFSVFYSRGAVSFYFFSPFIILVTSVEAFVLIQIFNLAFNKKNYFSV